MFPDDPQKGAETAELDIKNVLLVDDDDDLTEALKELLESKNFLVTVVRNGVEGLKEVMDFDFDVIICDMQMPSMPGDMFYLAVERTKPKLCDRFIFVTAHHGEPRIDNFIQSVRGIALTKPFKINELVQVISLVLRQSFSRPSDQ